MSAFDRIIPEKAFQMAGFKYHPDDIERIVAHGVEGCRIKTEGDLAVFLTEQIKQSPLSQEVEENLQSLVQDEQGRNYLSSCNDIEKVISLVKPLEFDEKLIEVKKLLDEWLQMGVHEIMFDWYSAKQGW